MATLIADLTKESRKSAHIATKRCTMQHCMLQIVLQRCGKVFVVFVMLKWRFFVVLSGMW